MHHPVVVQGKTEAPARIRRLATAGAALLATAMLFLIVVIPAQAHPTSTTLWGDWSYAYMSGDHSLLYGCDQHADGHKAYIRRYDVWGSPYPLVYDPDGAGGGCAVVAVNDWPLGSYNICVQYEGCARPVYRSEF